MNGHIGAHGNGLSRSGLPMEWAAPCRVVTSTAVTFVGIVAECAVTTCLVVISADAGV